MESSIINKSMKRLSTCFYLQVTILILSVVISFVNYKTFSSIGPSLGVLMVGVSVAFCVSLGQLASYLGKRWYVWVGLTILTNPVGYFVAYLMMKQQVNEALR